PQVLMCSLPATQLRPSIVASPCFLLHEMWPSKSTRLKLPTTGCRSTSDEMRFKRLEISITSAEEALLLERQHRNEAIKLNPSSTSAEDGQHHELSQKGSRQRTEVLERDARRRIQELAGKYICPCCDYCASFPSKVKRHMANKHSDSHLCSKCNMRFDTFSMLRKHVSSEHPKVHHCEYCSFSHKIKAAVRRHTTANHENGVMCTVAGCNMRVSRWRLRAHIEKEHPCHQPLIASRVLRSEGCRTRTQTALLKCSHCNFDTNDLDDYNSHVMSAHEIGIECPMPDCSVRFLLGDMDSHFATLHGGSTFEDSFIDKNAASYTTTTTSECVSTSNCSGAPCSDLVDFIPPKIMGASRGNSGGKFTARLHCSLCGKDYRDFYLLRKHIKSVHERSYAKYFRPLKYSCNWPGCKKAFTTCGLLRDHVNTHRGQLFTIHSRLLSPVADPGEGGSGEAMEGLKPYRCANCESSFYARARFAVHLSKYHRISIRDYSRVSHLLKRPTLANDNEK
ncbi:hypothetical protein ANCCAN_10575, partial [Ancylostoma caninum]